jgi:hypothetical protein
MAKPKPPTMTVDEARALLHRWDDRKPGEHKLVLLADRILAEAWEERRKRSIRRPLVC